MPLPAADDLPSQPARTGAHPASPDTAARTVLDLALDDADPRAYADTEPMPYLGLEPPPPPPGAAARR